MTTRYCPSCDLEGMPPYTIWVAVKHEDIGWYDKCVNDQYEDDGESYHPAYIQDGAYYVMCKGVSHDNVIIDRMCEVDSCDCSKIIKLLLDALRRETDNGTFDPAMWAPTFPKHTIKMVGWSRKVAQVALVDQLPLVLVKIVVSYLW